MGALQTTVQGAGLLKGSEFLLYSDWKTLADRPDFDLFEQTNKARDIVMRTDVIIRSRKRDIKYQKELEDLWKQLKDLMEEHYNFSAIEGSNEWKNEYWQKLSYLLYCAYWIQAQEKIIETEGSQNLTAAFSMDGDPDGK